MATPKKVGLLGGTFDPIHIAHLQLALEAKEYFELDEVIFCPAFLSPFKENRPPMASPEERLEMVRLAVQDIDFFRVLDYEVINKKISYTIETLEYLHRQHPATKYFLILGKDVIHSFFSWKEPHKLLEMAQPLIGERGGQETFMPSQASAKEKEILQKGFFKNHSIEVSSTYLRERLAKGVYCGHLIPPKVLDYIVKHRLYLTL
ncbi:MAG: nicotinate (nicotinamide) nucleotide adenylyltransferase [Chlamydiae bacterium]|nr:nicotinate (nicotinamide) nucleotide adenylyltransferase [Chlamydiota bacterium]